MAKVVVIGLDGFNPDLVELWKEELPHLARIMEEGIYGKVESTVPPITPQAWTCAQSSKNPGQFGFWDFTFRRDFSYGEPLLVNSREIKVDTLYRILPRYGKKVAIINVPVSYPPPEIPNGYSVSCFLTPSLDKTFTHPSDLREDIEKVGGQYIIDASLDGINFRLLDKDVVLKRIYEMDRQKFKLIEYFYQEKKCDYVFGVIMGTDRMPHLFYRYFDEKHVRYEPHARYGVALKEHYQFCDQKIGELRQKLDRDTALVVHSDHSVQRLDGRINLNEWLAREGYLQLHSRPSSPTPLKDCRVDWSKTIAWATGYTGQIYLNMKGREAQGLVSPSDYHAVLDELSEKLKALPGEKGQPLDTETFKRVDLHSGPYSKYGPDLFIYFDQCRYNISEMMGYDSLYSYDTGKGADDGGHGRTGFFAMAGPGIPAIGELNGMTLLDIAPTILSLMELPVPEDMEGQSLLQMERGNIYSPEDEEEVRKRLQGLGYLG
jgi:predicted AlkP superfamily phosphohydrolase/phosphomutase